MTSATDFGKALRRQREQRGIALTVIAEQTKIGHTFLTALERGDCSKWPGGIYSRAWIRAYAAAIGLDPEDAAAKFIKCFAQNAFPEGEPTPPIPQDLPRITPLRLTLAPDPQERVRVATRRSLLFVADLFIAMLAAAVVALLTVAGFWTAFAGATLACHAVGLFGGGGSAAGWLDRFVRRHARPHEEPADSAIAEAA